MAPTPAEQPEPVSKADANTDFIESDNAYVANTVDSRSRAQSSDEVQYVIVRITRFESEAP